MAAQDCPITPCHAALVMVFMKDSRVVIRLYESVCVCLGIWACLWEHGGRTGLSDSPGCSLPALSARVSEAAELGRRSWQGP